MITVSGIFELTVFANCFPVSISYFVVPKRLVRSLLFAENISDRCNDVAERGTKAITAPAVMQIPIGILSN